MEGEQAEVQMPNQNPQPQQEQLAPAADQHRHARRPFPPEVPVSALFRWLGITTHKTEYCRHNSGCIESVLQSFCDSFTLGYLIRTGVSLVFGLKKIIKGPTALFGMLVSRDNLAFAMFLASFSSLFKAVICVCRRKWGDSPKASILAGFLAGILSILFLHQKTRQNLALFLLTRALDTIYNSLVNRGIIPKWKYDYVLLYSLMMTITGYCYGNEPGCLTPEMNKFYLSFTNESINDLQMRQIWVERKNNELLKQGIPRQDPLDYMPKLKKYYEKLAASGKP